MIEHRTPEKEFADDRVRTLPTHTTMRLRQLKYTRCSCGEQARHVIGDRFVCSGCRGWADTQRRFKRMTEEGF